MKVLSFNVLSDEYLEFNNPKFLERWYPNIKPEDLRLKNRVPAIIETIKFMDADIVCLQEVMVPLRLLLIKMFPDFYVSKLAVHQFMEKKSGNLVMLRKSNFDMKSIIEVPSEIGRGYAQMTVIAHPIKNKKVQLKPYVIMSLHLIDTAYKFEQAKLVKELFDIYKKGTKIIVAGDFNTNEAKIHNIFTGIGFKSGINPKVKYRGTYLCEKPMIDYIYATGFKKITAFVYNEPTKCSAASCYISTIRKYGTDHYPIYAAVEG